MPTLRDLRKLALLSSTELADAVQVSRKTIWEWEHAQSRPSPAHQRRLVVFLKISPAELLQAIEETAKESKKELAAA